MTYEEKLEARVRNLETCIQGLFVVISDTLPPSALDDAYRLMEKHYDATRSFGDDLLSELEFIHAPPEES